jgi:hypothetical protein
MVQFGPFEITAIPDKPHLHFIHPGAIQAADNREPPGVRLYLFPLVRWHEMRTCSGKPVTGL